MRPYRHLLLAIAILALAVVWVAGGLPWWGKAILIFGVLVALGTVGQSLMRSSWQRALAKGLEETSKALRGAGVTVHSVSIAALPPHPEFGADVDGPIPSGGEADRPAPPNVPLAEGTGRYVAIDLTVAPAAGPAGQPGTGATQGPGPADASADPPSWEPSNFTLVPLDAVVDQPAADLLRPDANSESIATVECAEILDQAPPDPRSPAGSNAAGAVAADPRSTVWLVGPHRIRLIFRIPPGMPRRVRLRYLYEDFAELDLPM